MSKYSYIKIKTPKSCKDCPFYALEESFEQGCGWTTAPTCVVGGRQTYDFGTKERAVDCPLKEWKSEKVFNSRGKPC